MSNFLAEAAAFNCGPALLAMLGLFKGTFLIVYFLLVIWRKKSPKANDSIALFRCGSEAVAAAAGNKMKRKLQQ